MEIAPGWTRRRSQPLTSIAFPRPCSLSHIGRPRMRRQAPGSRRMRSEHGGSVGWRRPTHASSGGRWWQHRPALTIQGIRLCNGQPPFAATRTAGGNRANGVERVVSEPRAGADPLADAPVNSQGIRAVGNAGRRPQAQPAAQPRIRVGRAVVAWLDAVDALHRHEFVVAPDLRSKRQRGTSRTCRARACPMVPKRRRCSRLADAGSDVSVRSVVTPPGWLGSRIARCGRPRSARSIRGALGAGGTGECATAKAAAARLGATPALRSVLRHVARLLRAGEGPLRH